MGTSVNTRSSSLNYSSEEQVENQLAKFVHKYSSENTDTALFLYKLSLYYSCTKMETYPLFEKHKRIFIDLMNTNSANHIDKMARVGAYLADHCVKQNL